MAGPTLVASYPVYQNTSNTTALVTPSFTPSNGEIVVVKLYTWDTTIAGGAPTGGSQTYTSRVIAAPGGFNAWVGIYTAVISGSPGSMTISSTPATACRHGMVVERWSGAALAGSPAVNSTKSGSGAPSATLTSTGTGSIVTWVSGDASSKDPATRAYRSSATEDGLQDGHTGSNSVGYFAYQDAPTAGTQTMGLTLPAAQTWVLAGIEIQAAAGGGISAPLATASETATAQTLHRTKRRTTGPASETATARTLARVKRRLLGVGSETGAARPLGRRKVRALGTAVETATAQHPGRRKVRHMGVATETATAQHVGRRKRRALLAAVETAAAQSLANVLRQAVTAAVESGTARALGRLKRRLLGTAVETARAQPLQADVLPPLPELSATARQRGLLSATTAQPGRLSASLQLSNQLTARLTSTGQISATISGE